MTSYSKNDPYIQLSIVGSHLFTSRSSILLDIVLFELAKKGVVIKPQNTHHVFKTFMGITTQSVRTKISNSLV